MSPKAEKSCISSFFKTILCKLTENAKKNNFGLNVKHTVNETACLVGSEMCIRDRLPYKAKLVVIVLHSNGCYGHCGNLVTNLL